MKKLPFSYWHIFYWVAIATLGYLYFHKPKNNYYEYYQKWNNSMKSSIYAYQCSERRMDSSIKKILVRDIESSFAQKYFKIITKIDTSANILIFNIEKIERDYIIDTEKQDKVDFFNKPKITLLCNEINNFQDSCYTLFSKQELTISNYPA